jgi:rare lipoprotein A
MRLILTYNKYRPAAHFFCFIFFVFFFFPLSVDAQKKSASGKAIHKKTTRVFYGQASYYSNKFNGRKTASGEIFDQKKLTCACNILPLGSYIKVTNLRNHKSVIVKVNDRIHPKMKRLVDLSRSGAQKLGYISSGLTRVKVELLDEKVNFP